jgi:hypothetical protein
MRFASLPLPNAFPFGVNSLGNVAAGGQKNGYWFETRNERAQMSLGTFKDNEVHSCQSMAFSVYSPGWRPNEVAVIENLKVYRNPSDGAFLHVTKNLHFQDGKCLSALREVPPSRSADSS